MTGITRDELMQMARQSGGAPLIEGSNTLLFSPLDIEKLYNAILEGAAVECEEFGFSEDRPRDYGVRIRALKINTGD